MDADNGFEKYEGYVGNEEDFNGIIFYLREPNTNGDKAKEFWFKRIIIDREKYYQELEEAKCERIGTDKKTASKFKNRFNEMLEQLGMSDKQLKDVAYSNVNSECGESSVTTEYKKKLSASADKLEKIIANMNKDELITFTCKDIFNELCQAWSVKEIHMDGLKYNNKEEPLQYFSHIIDGKKITVYEILHPSRSSALQND